MLLTLCEDCLNCFRAMHDGVKEFIQIHVIGVDSSCKAETHNQPLFNKIPSSLWNKLRQTSANVYFSQEHVHMRAHFPKCRAAELLQLEYLYCRLAIITVGRPPYCHI